MATMHEVDYKVYGDDMQFVEIELDPQEAAIAEAGGMMYMDDWIEMETIFGDGSQQNSGFFGALLGAGKRLLTGESLFMTVFQNRGAGKKQVAFGAPYPGKITSRRSAAKSSPKRIHSCAPPKGSASASRSTRRSAPACSAAKGSSCSGYRATAGPSCMPAARFMSVTSGRES